MIISHSFYSDYRYELIRPGGDPYIYDYIKEEKLIENIFEENDFKPKNFVPLFRTLQRHSAQLYVTFLNDDHELYLKEIVSYTDGEV